MASDAPVKDLYEVGEIPPLGHVPSQMRAWAIGGNAMVSRINPSSLKPCQPRNRTAMRFLSS